MNPLRIVCTNVNIHLFVQLSLSLPRWQSPAFAYVDTKSSCSIGHQCLQVTSSFCIQDSSAMYHHSDVDTVYGEFLLHQPCCHITLVVPTWECLSSSSISISLRTHPSLAAFAFSSACFAFFTPASGMPPF